MRREIQMITDIFASFYSEFKTRISSPRIIVENFLNPLFILFIFGIAMSQFFGEVKLDDGRTIPYIAYFLVGSINIGLITNCMVSTTRLFLDKYTGLFNYLLSQPLHRYSILIGRMLFHILVSLIQILLMVGFTKLVYKDSISFDYKFVLFLIYSLLNSCAFFCFLYCIAFKIEKQDSFNVLYYLIMTPVIYISSIYYPIDSLALPIKVMAYLNPLTWSTDVSRYLLLGMNNGKIGYESVATLLFFIISFVASVYIMKHDELLLK